MVDRLLDRTGRVIRFGREHIAVSSDRRKRSRGSTLHRIRAINCNSLPLQIPIPMKHILPPYVPWLFILPSLLHWAHQPHQTLTFKATNPSPALCNQLQFAFSPNPDTNEAHSAAMRSLALHPPYPHPVTIALPKGPLAWWRQPHALCRFHMYSTCACG